MKSPPKISAAEKNNTDYYWTEKISRKDEDGLLQAGGILITGGLIWLEPGAIVILFKGLRRIRMVPGQKLAGQLNKSV